MKYFVGGYALIEVVVSTVLCYLWLIWRIEKKVKKIEENERNKKEWKAFNGTFLFACSSCFYQAHHQIMFVNYMPFLILAFIGVDRVFQKKNNALLTIALFGIYIHSFYYSISCLTAIFIYIIWNILKKSMSNNITQMYYLNSIKSGRQGRKGNSRNNQEIIDFRGNQSSKQREGKTKKKSSGKFVREFFREWKNTLLLIVGSSFLSIGMAMFFLFPVALDILSTVKDGGKLAKQGMEFINLSMEGLLYSPYGCGMTIFSLYILIYALREKKIKYLSIVLLFIMIVPAISLILNGFLYAQVKILIPFLPLIVLVASEELYKMKKRKDFPVTPVLFCLIVIIFSKWRVLVLVDTGLLLLWISICRIFVQKETKKRGISRTSKIFYFIFLMPVLLSIGANASDSYLKQICNKIGISAAKRSEGYVYMDDKRQQHFKKEELEQEIDTSNYRLDIVANTFANINMLYGGKIRRTTMYSSITDSEYAIFYYDIMHNAISLNNRVALLQGNPLFNWWMGVRYLIVEKGKIPVGYKVVKEKEKYLLVENENVLPICYGTTSQEDISNALNPEKAKKNWKEKFKKEDIYSIFSEKELKKYYILRERGKIIAFR